MKLQRDFKAPVEKAGATRLREQLVAFAGDVQNALIGVLSVTLRRLRVAARISNTEGLTVAPGESIGIIAAVTRVQLAVPSAANAGTFLVICQFPGVAVTTTVYAPEGSLINGAATYVLPTNGRAYVVYCDGVDYWTDQ